MKQSGQTLRSDNLQQLLDSAANAAQLGAQQFFTPVDVAAVLSRLLPDHRPAITDLQCGSGNLLAAAANETTKALLGLDIDPRARCPRNAGDKAKGHLLCGDLTKAYPLLAEADWHADLFVLNPPFSLRWDPARLAALRDSDVPAVAHAFAAAGARGWIDSTLATLLIALDRCTDRGEGLLLCNQATAEKFLDAYPDLRDHLWLWLVLPNVFPGTDPGMQIAALYFARSHTGGPEGGPRRVPGRTAATIADTLADLQRLTLRNGADVSLRYYADHESADRFQTVADEYRQREKPGQTRWNLWLADGRIRTWLTPFQAVSVRVPRELASELHGLNGQTPLNLVVQKASRTALLRAVHSPVWTVDPALVAAVEKAVGDYNATRAPFYPLNDVQRLGYLDEEDSITCKRDLDGFTAGTTYSLATRTIEVRRLAVRPNLLGEPEDLEISGQDLLIEIRDDAGHRHVFLLEPKPEEYPGATVHDLRALTDHFVIPQVLDIAQTRPDAYRDNVRALGALEAEHAPFRLRSYQKDDLARAATLDGLILGWDPGLGKTTAAYAWPRLKGARRVLIVAPEGLHRQTIDEFALKFGATLKPLLTHADYWADTELHDARRAGEEGRPHPVVWRITTYQALGYNGADEWEPKIHPKTGAPVENRNALASRRALAASYRLHDFEENPGYQEGIGREKVYNDNTPDRVAIKCVATPCLARLINSAFDCVAVDEGVRLKSSDAYVSLGVRTLTPRYRLVLTGTPIKNHLDDLFWLAHWACGGHAEPSPRWPYENSDAAKERFAAEHLLTERNLTREEQAYERTGTRRRFVKRTSTLCNIHRLWKLLGPVLIRRRKDDCGEDLVKKTVIPVRVRPGTAQQQVYTRYLKNRPVASKMGTALKGGADIGVQLQLLRQAALCPDSPQLAEADLGDADGPRRSWTDLNPKSAAIYALIAERLETGNQVIILAPFRHFGVTLADRLRRAGVSVCHLDGATSPKKRGEIARQFKAGKYAVLVGGLESMSEGHSFECCKYLVLPSLSWAWDKNAQAIDRIHRLTSREDVTVYVMICENTVDEKLHAVFSERTDSSQLALDGRLIETHTEEINLGRLLADAMDHFDPHAATFDEQAMENEWERTLRARLHNAEQAFRQWVPPVDNAAAAEPVTVEEARAEVAPMAAALDPAEAVRRRQQEIRDRLEKALAALQEL